MYMCSRSDGTDTDETPSPGGLGGAQPKEGGGGTPRITADGHLGDDALQLLGGRAALHAEGGEALPVQQAGVAQPGLELAGLLVHLLPRGPQVPGHGLALLLAGVGPPEGGDRLLGTTTGRNVQNTAGGQRDASAAVWGSRGQVVCPRGSACFTPQGQHVFPPMVSMFYPRGRLGVDACYKHACWPAIF